MARRLVTPSIADFPEYLKNIEAKWRPKVARRTERERFVSEKGVSGNSQKTRYILSMFPYPSGNLHLGHVRTYTSSDILTRYSRMMSKNQCHLSNFTAVINPMGFDSFGLPAENAARERNLNPAIWTNTNIRTMKKQLDDLAIQFDWREATSNSNFYRWTQELFLKLLQSNLVYKSFAQVNWDPIDQTVLADEQVDENGRSWRSGAKVERRFARQWFVKVHAFTNEIWKASDINLELWDDIVSVQRGWIGTPCGWIFYLPISNPKDNTTDTMPIFTRKPELFASEDSVLAVSNKHWIKSVYNISDGYKIMNPFNRKKIKLYFTGSDDQLPLGTKATIQTPYDNQSISQSFSVTAREQILLHARLNHLGGYYTSEKYRDWLISRQRFWGTPIPAVSCRSCGIVGVNSQDLPVTLPKVANISDQSKSKLVKTRDQFQVATPLELVAPDEWLKTTCPSCGSDAVRECETFDTLVDSSWYFLRYSSEPKADRAFDLDKVQPVWCYIGGKEHAAMHLFYARFMTHFLHSLGQLKFREPFESLLVQGIVKGKTYKLDGRYISKEEADQVKDKKKLSIEFEKMSKSKGNGVDPTALIEKYGTDATRFCLMSYANPKSERLWRSNDEEFREIMMHLRKIFMTVHEYANIGLSLLAKDPNPKIKVVELDNEELLNKKKLLKEVRSKTAIDAIYYTEETYQFRQVISFIHGLNGFLRQNTKNSSVYTHEFAEALATLIIMLNPFIPHLSEELWSIFCQTPINPLRMSTNSPYNTSMQVSDQSWPLPDLDHGRSHCFKKPICEIK